MNDCGVRCFICGGKPEKDETLKAVAGKWYCYECVQSESVRSNWMKSVRWVAHAAMTGPLVETKMIKPELSEEVWYGIVGLLGIFSLYPKFKDIIGKETPKFAEEMMWKLAGALNEAEEE